MGGGGGRGEVGEEDLRRGGGLTFMPKDDPRPSFLLVISPLPRKMRI